MRENLATLVTSMMDDIEDVQLIDNTWQEGRQALTELHAIVAGYCGPLCEETIRLHRLVRELQAQLGLPLEPEPVLELDETVVYAVADWPQGRWCWMPEYEEAEGV